MSIRFVPEAEHAPAKKNSGKSLTVKFEISPSVNKMYKVLIEGGIEAFINHINVHKIFLADCKVKEDVVAARSPLLVNG